MTTIYAVPANGHTFDLYLYDFAPELQRVALDLFELLAGVVPAWCRAIHCHFGDSEGADATCQADYDYRNATIVIGAKFFRHDEADRVETLLHELLHVQCAPMADTARDAIKSLLAGQPEGAGAAIRATITGAAEQTVCDLTAALLPTYTEPAR